MGRCPTLETERLVLRPFREDDVDAYTAVLQSPQVRASLHAHHDVDAIYSVILHENAASQGAARRLGFTPGEARVLSHFPEMPRVIWRLDREARAHGTTRTP